MAKRLTARAVAQDAAAGALVAGLNMFEQGYYDQLGFGTLAYKIGITFDPALLKVKAKFRPPRRLSGKRDYAAAHQARVSRRRAHGAVNFTSPDFTRADMMGSNKNFGLGYHDGPKGALSHYIWCCPQHIGSGPYYIGWLIFQTDEQFLELLALIKTLGDQVRCVHVNEPPGIQLQDFIEYPIRQHQLTEKTRFESRTHAFAGDQARICDLPGCLAQTRLPMGELRFNLELSDPITPCLGKKEPWRGIGGNYVVTLGPSSGAEAGVSDSLPALAASVGAFTRLWLGVRPASGLAVSDDLAGPPELLEALDWVFRLPPASFDWGF